MDRIETNNYDNKDDGHLDNRRRTKHANERHTTARRFPRSRLQKTLVFFSLCAALLLARLLFPSLELPLHVSQSSSSYSPEAERACRDIQAAYPSSQKTTHFPGDAAYWAELSHYWSKSLAELRPTCVVQPTTAAQVAAVIRVLNHHNHTSVRFAVKSGGTTPTRATPASMVVCSSRCAT
ncbi:FAD-linked oxidoreductase [Apiospora saccharicola]